MRSNNTQGAQILIHQSESRHTQTATAGIQKENYIYPLSPWYCISRFLYFLSLTFLYFLSFF